MTQRASAARTPDARARTLPRSAAVAAGAILALALPSAAAEDEGGESQNHQDKRFTTVEESRTTEDGGWELEQLFTWKTHTGDDNSFNRYEFKHEADYGITERFQAGIDLIEWHIQTGDEKDGPRYDGTGLELKYRFLDPIGEDPVGLAIKAEAAAGPESLDLEARLIVDKVLGPFRLAYNLGIGAGWEGEDYGYHDRDGEISQSAGVSYQFSKNWYVGGEALHEVPLPDWNTGAPQNLSIGPNLSYHGAGWAITATALPQVAGPDEEPAFQVRALLEIEF